MLKVGSDGSSADILVGEWEQTSDLTYGRDPSNPYSFTQATKSAGTTPAAVGEGTITNADQGALLSWEEDFPGYGATLTDEGCTSNIRKPRW